MLKLLDVQEEFTEGIIIHAYRYEGKMIDADGKTESPILYGYSVDDLTKKARTWFAENGAHDRWPHGLELRVRETI